MSFLSNDALVRIDTADWTIDGVFIGDPDGVEGVDFFTFNPPTRESPRISYPIEIGDERFWNHFRRPPTGMNVYVLTDGTYTTSAPSTTGVLTYTYIGGHKYRVSPAEHDRLVAAGYA